MNAHAGTGRSDAPAQSRRSHRRWRFYFLAGVATGTSRGIAIG